MVTTRSSRTPMSRNADGPPVPSNQRPFVITVSYCIDRPLSSGSAFWIGGDHTYRELCLPMLSAYDAMVSRRRQRHDGRYDPIVGITAYGFAVR